MLENIHALSLDGVVELIWDQEIPLDPFLGV
jgi:hypothetical protein